MNAEAARNTFNQAKAKRTELNVQLNALVSAHDNTLKMTRELGAKPPGELDEAVGRAYAAYIVAVAERAIAIAAASGEKESIALEFGSAIPLEAARPFVAPFVREHFERRGYTVTAVSHYMVKLTWAEPVAKAA